MSRDAVVTDSSSDPTSRSDAEMALHSGPKLRLGARAFVLLHHLMLTALGEEIQP